MFINEGSCNVCVYSATKCELEQHFPRQCRERAVILGENIRRLLRRFAPRPVDNYIYRASEAKQSRFSAQGKLLEAISAFCKFTKNCCER